MVTCNQQEKVASSPKVLLEYKYKIYFEGMLNETVYEWVRMNSHSMSRPAGTKPVLYKQIVVRYKAQC